MTCEGGREGNEEEMRREEEHFVACSLAVVRAVCRIKSEHYPIGLKQCRILLKFFSS